MNDDYANGICKKYGWEEKKADAHFARAGRRITDECRACGIDCRTAY